MRITRLVAILIAVALVGGAAMAFDRDDVIRAQFPNVPEGTLYDRNELNQMPDRLITLPMPIEDSGEMQPLVIPKSSTEVVSAEASTAFVFGSAIPRMGSGPVLTEHQRAQREIRQLIKKLD